MLSHQFGISGQVQPFINLRRSRFGQPETELYAGDNVSRCGSDKVDAIHDAARVFEATADVMIANYQQQTTNLPPTTRIDHFAEIEF